MAATDVFSYVNLLQKWVSGALPHIFRLPDRPELACYGTGEDTWGVQTNQKAFAALATIASHPQYDSKVAGISSDELKEIALSMLRYSIQSHIEGDYHCTDNVSWGHTWISVLGLERMMQGVEALGSFLTEADKLLLRKVLISESDWLLDHYQIVAGLYNKEGKNKPESNLWNGSLMLRTAFMYPDCPRADEYREKALKYFINAISVPSDAHSDSVIEGKKVSDLFVGANFFESMALNHHGYLNVGYMVICLSNMAMLHFMYRGNGEKAPEALYHHMKELWDVIKLCTFEDGRLLRIGGDTRARYTYCQDYVIPMWHMIEDLLGDPDCARFEEGWLKQIALEMEQSGDGSFLSGRCGKLAVESPLYFTRLESDRAVALSMGLTWKELALEGAAARKQAGAASETAVRAAAESRSPVVRDDFGQGWHDEYHGAFVHRSARRIASWVWESAEKPQGLCLPEGASDMAEWKENLSPHLRGIGKLTEQQLEQHTGALFPGGFITWGSTIIHTQGMMAEGQKDHAIARNRIVCAALPDNTHMVVLQYTEAVRRTHIREVKGLGLYMPNDLFNGSTRKYAFEAGEAELQGAGSSEDTYGTGSRWLNIDGRLGVYAAYGTEQLDIYRPGRRQIGLKEKLATAGSTGMLYADEICGPCRIGLQAVVPGQAIVDAGFVLLAGEGPEATRAAAGSSRAAMDGVGGDGIVRIVYVTGADGYIYALAANFGEVEQSAWLDAAQAVDVSTGYLAGVEAGNAGKATIVLPAGQARLVRLIG